MLILQKGEAPEAMAAAKKELDIKRAASASKGAKVFYKVTVKVSAYPAPLFHAMVEARHVTQQQCGQPSFLLTHCKAISGAVFG